MSEADAEQAELRAEVQRLTERLAFWIDGKAEWVEEAMKLRQGLWDVWAALGHDTDGDTGPGALIAGMGTEGFISMVIRDATTWRRETEEDYANDTDRLEARAKAAEAKLAHHHKGHSGCVVCGWRGVGHPLAEATKGGA